MVQSVAEDIIILLTHLLTDTPRFTGILFPDILPAAYSIAA